MLAFFHKHKSVAHTQNQIFPALIGVVGMLVITAGMLQIMNLIGQKNIENAIVSAGIWAPILFILLRVSRVFLPPVGGPPFILLAGTLFGFVAGSVYAIIADSIAYFLNYLIAKNLGRPFLSRLLGASGVEKLDHLSSTILHDQPFLLGLVLITDTFDIAEYAVGLTEIRVKTVISAILLCTITTIPTTIALGFAAGSNQALLFAALSGVTLIGLIPILFQKQLHSFIGFLNPQN